MIELTVVLNEEQVRELFDNCEVKFSKKKVKELKDMVNEVEMDIQEQLEDTLREQLEELIADEFGE